MMSPPDIVDVIRGAIRDVVPPLSASLERAEQELAALRVELVELRISEQASANLAEIGTAQAIDLRKRLEAAEQRAADERERADRAEQRTDDEKIRVEEAKKRAEQEVTALRAELVELRISERAAGDIAEYATGEVGDLRKRLDESEQRAAEAERRMDVERTKADHNGKRVDEEWARADRERARAENAEHRIKELEAELQQARRRRSWWPWRR
jgi:hypothetical protein